MSVCSYNEWDPLEECIVGVGSNFSTFKEGKLQAIDQKLIEAVKSELEGVAYALSREGVTVTRPDVVDCTQAWNTPVFASGGTASGAVNPRDLLLIVGNEMIEANMGHQSRFFEYIPYRSLIQKYWRGGARWTAAPKIVGGDASYYKLEQMFKDYPETSQLCELLARREAFLPEEYPDWVSKMHDDNAFITTEHEPIFDAADFTRFGRDIFGNRGFYTNKSGIEWMRTHLTDYRVHELNFKDAYPIHMDATFVPIRPGLVVASPERLPKDASIFEQNDWTIAHATPPQAECVTRWFHINVLMLDEKRVLVNEKEKDFIKFLESFGCKAIPLPITNCNKVGGGFHCVTSDVRRRGECKSYFPSLDK